MPKAKFDDARKKLVDAIKARHKQVTRAVKDLGKLQEERDAREQEVRLAAEREIVHLHETRNDLIRILQSTTEAEKNFYITGNAEIVENEYNLNLPRYVDTFTEKPSYKTAAVISQLNEILKAKGQCWDTLKEIGDGA